MAFCKIGSVRSAGPIGDLVIVGSDRMAAADQMLCSWLRYHACPNNGTVGSAKHVVGVSGALPGVIYDLTVTAICSIVLELVTYGLVLLADMRLRRCQRARPDAVHEQEKLAP
jgi:hypothetical protein